MDNTPPIETVCGLPTENNVAEETPVAVAPKANRGRPRLNVNWPDGEFTFSALTEGNTLSSSSLRKKMRAELSKGNLLKVDTLKVAFGRPQNVYKKA